MLLEIVIGIYSQSSEVTEREKGAQSILTEDQTLFLDLQQDKQVDAVFLVLDVSVHSWLGAHTGFSTTDSSMQLQHLQCSPLLWTKAGMT